MQVNSKFLSELVSGISADKMMEHLQEFSRWQKLAGSDGEARSLGYVRKVLDGYGLSTTLLMHDAFISLPQAAHVDFDGQRLTCITHSMALPTPPAGLTRPIVDLGDGSQAAFDAADVADAIVLIDGMATPEMALRSRKAGVAGQIHISPYEHLHEMCLSPIWGSPDTETVQNLPASSAVTISRDDGTALRARLAADTGLVATLHAKVDTGWRKTPILIADIDAGDAPDDAPYILFSGHHDTWYEGVMDNGSANATMMEIARCMAPLRQAMKRPLRLCFWSGHSQGRYSGSTWFADTHWHELERNCAVHVNVDSTGGEGNTLLSRAPAATELCALAREAIAAHSDQSHDGSRLARNSDQSFWGIGIPSLFGILSCKPADTVGVRNALGWWWHTPHDQIDHIDPALLLRDTRIYAHALARLVADPCLPFDLAAQAADLAATLAGIGLPAGQDQQLNSLLAEAGALQAELTAFQVQQPETEEACVRRDRTLMRVSRQMVPLDYTTGDRHRHDPSLPLPKWPSLEPLRRLAQETPGTDAFLLRQGPAMRAANRILSGLRAARAELAAAGSGGSVA
ncbi:M28 family metallopeptidase [Hoeflea ulvae]|uniref:M28 family metallopeptidase n=1 Tax=Hoeflea ulvae TaxID=2983764 RepID=A0ABT3YCZ7_9HYPH|nr:M28 family peptidase [Hoeflea ulvae]MCY0093760.1 M28 family metallopeptidase [Hoeflea ulvae]